MEIKEGDTIRHFTGTTGKIVRINYVFAYPDANGLPATKTIEKNEIEDKPEINGGLGFKKGE